MRRFVVAMALLAACGDDDSGSGPLTADKLPGALINTICSAYVRCGLISDANTCRSLLGREFEIDADVLAAIDNGSVVFNESEARLCLAGFGGTCEGNRINDENDHCDLVFEGTVAAGGACGISEQCVSGQCSIPSCPDACCYGTCVGDAPPPRPRIGEACGTYPCIDSFCDSTTLICTARKGIGAPCESENECAQGTCTGVCTTLPGPGEPCVQRDALTECNSIGLYCGVDNECVPYALDGETCGQTTICSPAYRCVGSICELQPTLGDSCTSNCIDGSWCDPSTQRCAAPQPDGAQCESNNQCIGDCEFGSGSAGTCVTPPICV